MNNRSDMTIAWWLALFLFVIYLLSFSGRIYSVDGLSMFSVTDSFVKRGEFNTDQLWTLFKARNEIAPDGESYAKYGYGISLLAVPLYALALALQPLGLVQTTLLTSSLVVAATAALLFLAARRLRFSLGVSLAVALLFGLATPAWVYAKQFWSETYALLVLFAAFYFLLRFRQDLRDRDALVAGLALGLAVATRQTNIILVPLFAWYGFGRVLSESRLRRGGLLFALMLSLVLLSIAYYDWVRYGNVLATGYRPDETFRNPILMGLFGLLFSPGKGLFVYAPFLVVLPWSMVLLYRRARQETFLVLAIVAVYLPLYASWYAWSGGLNWGPRFLVPTLPFLVLAVAPTVESLVNGASGSPKVRLCLRAMGSVLCALSFAIQVLGTSIPSLWYRLYVEGISQHPEEDSIFGWQLSPLVGYLRIMKPDKLDFGWIRAMAYDVRVDWLVIALTLSFMVFCGWMLLRAYTGSKAHGLALPATFILAMVLALFSVYRYSNDPHFLGSQGYRELLQDLARQAEPQDVMILNNDIYVFFFLNENRAAIRWYGLSRDPKQWDAATQALLGRLAQRYARVWFALDDSTADLPDPTQSWLRQSLRQVAQYDFPDGVHLLLFTTEAPP